MDEEELLNCQLQGVSMLLYVAVSIHNVLGTSLNICCTFNAETHSTIIFSKFLGINIKFFVEGLIQNTFTLYFPIPS